MVSCWENALKTRISRRRALTVTGTAALGTTLFAACGGGDGTTATNTSSLLSVPVDTSSQAVPGGTFSTWFQTDIPTADPHKAPGTIPLQRLTDYYDFLVKYGRDGKEGRYGTIGGDAAESWEFSPDGLTLTFKLRPNHQFDQRPPTSGRAMTSADVKFSWDRMLANGPFAGTITPKNPDSPFASLNAMDDRTVVVKLNYPYLSTLDLFTHYRYLMLMPKETDEGKFDPKSETRGAGPFYLDKWEPSVRVNLKRNPAWYEKGQPYFDGITENTIPDNAATLAQYEAGALWDGAGYKPEDVLRVKNDHPEMVLRQTFPVLGGGSSWTTSKQPGSIFLDTRARQALSMLIDRDLYLSVVQGTDQFTSAGLPVVAKWDTHIPAANSEWLDPKKNELGENSKYFQYDVAEAKKLLSAAGYNQSSQALSLEQGDTHDARALEVLRGMWSQAFNLEVKILPYQTTWRSVCQRSAGQDYSGVCYNTGSGLNAELHISRWYTAAGESKDALGPEPAMAVLAQKIKTELDRNRQVELIKDFQKQAAAQMPLIPGIGTTTGFDLSWPWLQNFGVWTDEYSTHSRAYYWYDKSKDSRAKAS